MEIRAKDNKDMYSLQTPRPRVKSSGCETFFISSSPEKMLKTWVESAAPSAFKACQDGN